jgi:hypothetical protein
MALLDELARQISERTGIPADKAEAAARTAIDFLDDRLPPPIGGQLGKLVQGGGGGEGGMPDLGKLAGGLGGMFGGK